MSAHGCMSVSMCVLDQWVSVCGGGSVWVGVCVLRHLIIFTDSWGLSFLVCQLFCNLTITFDIYLFQL